MKEINKNILNTALGKLNTYDPPAQIWTAINENLNDLPLQEAIKGLAEYQPDEKIWESIEKGFLNRKRPYIANWYAAASVLLACGLGLWLFGPASSPAVLISQQQIDSRLQPNDEVVTDEQFLNLKAYCETETLVCSRSDFKQLTHEYETLREASRQLQQAMGDYNTEPGLIRQLSALETEKADILNKMAKMI